MEALVAENSYYILVAVLGIVVAISTLGLLVIVIASSITPDEVKENDDD